MVCVTVVLALPRRTFADNCGIRGDFKEDTMRSVIIDIVIKPSLSLAGKQKLGHLSERAVGVAIAAIFRNRNPATWPRWAHAIVDKSPWFGKNILYHLGFIYDVTKLAYDYARGRQVRAGVALLGANQLFTSLWPKVAAELGVAGSVSEVAAQGALVWATAMLSYNIASHYASQWRDWRRYYECHSFLRQFVRIHEVPGFLAKSKEDIVKHFIGRMMALDKAYIFAMRCYLKIRPEHERFALPPVNITFWNMHRQVDFNIKVQNDPQFRGRVYAAVERLYRTFGLFRTKILLDRIMAQPKMQVADAILQYVKNKHLRAAVCNEYRRRVKKQPPIPATTFPEPGRCYGPVIVGDLCPGELGFSIPSGTRCEYQFIPCPQGGYQVIRCPGCPEVGIIRAR